MSTYSRTVSGRRPIGLRLAVRAGIPLVVLVLLGTAAAWGYSTYQRVNAAIVAGRDDLLSGVRMLSGISPENLSAPDLERARAAFQASETSWTEVQVELGRLDFPVWWASRVAPGKYGRALAAAPSLVQMALHISAAGEQMADAVLPAANMLGSGTGLSSGGGGVEGLAVLMGDLRPRLASVTRELELAKAARAQIGDASSLPASIQGAVVDFDARLPNLEATLTTASDAFNALWFFLGMDGPRTYLILAQDDYELRATGGFIGSAGTVVVDNGKITSFEHGSSYLIDNPSRPHIAPPAPMVKYLKASALFFRDSNWWPDFPYSARVAEQILQMDTGKTVDGVVAFDLHALDAVLGVVGPVDVPEYGTTVSAENMMEQIYCYVYSPVWKSDDPPADPTALKGKAFLGRLGKAILAKMSHLSSEEYFKLGKEAHRLVTEKHLLLSAHDATAQNMIRQMGADGRIESGAGDYVYVVDTTVSYTKVAAFVQESMDYTVSLDDNMKPVTATLSISYTNGFKDSAVPEYMPVGQTAYDPATGAYTSQRGVYGDYVRIYVPVEATSVTVDGIDDPAQPADEFGRKVIGGYLLVRPGETRTVTLQYDLSSLPSPVAGNYDLIVQKQPGTDARPLAINVILGHNTAQLATRPQPSAQADGRLSYRLDLRETRRINLTSKP